MSIISARLQDCVKRNISTNDVLQIDEAAAFLVEDDKKELEAEQGHAKVLLEEANEFKEAFRANKKLLLTAAAAKKVKWHGPKHATFETLDQKILKTYLPPVAFIWRRRSDSTWNAKLLDFPYHSCRDQAWETEANAARECIRYAWEWYLCVEGYPNAACPIKNIFPL